MAGARSIGGKLVSAFRWLAGASKWRPIVKSRKRAQMTPLRIQIGKAPIAVTGPWRSTVTVAFIWLRRRDDAVRSIRRARRMVRAEREFDVGLKFEVKTRAKIWNLADSKNAQEISVHWIREFKVLAYETTRLREHRRSAHCPPCGFGKKKPETWKARDARMMDPLLTSNVAIDVAPPDAREVRYTAETL
ncbi:hypothetical protein C8R44DRAFT_726201 [Mycena epipterygia]|nr:hypothetical protein C8R44DRAFT_726201 [Mycena epipterygia]